VAQTTHMFAPNPPGPTQFDAVAFDADLAGVAAPAQAGDRLVLRFNNVGPETGAYTPNGDGSLVGGRVPNLTLP